MFSLHGELGIRDDFVEGTEIWLYLRTFDDYECETVSPLYRNGVKKKRRKMFGESRLVIARAGTHFGPTVFVHIVVA